MRIVNRNRSVAEIGCQDAAISGCRLSSAEFGWKTIEDYQRYRATGHVARMSDSQDTFRALHTSTCGLPKDWRCRPGLPRHTWLRTLNADLHPLNHGLNSAWRQTCKGQNDGGNSWKQLRSSLRLARDDDISALAVLSHFGWQLVGPVH